jgi:1-hydroxycarotenoid 3,4-desaturase
LSKSQRTIVIGAGVGGLAASIDLARRGVEVTLVERAETVGGKLRSLAPRGRPIQPSLPCITFSNLCSPMPAVDWKIT